MSERKEIIMGLEEKKAALKDARNCAKQELAGFDRAMHELSKLSNDVDTNSKSSAMSERPLIDRLRDCAGAWADFDYEADAAVCYEAADRIAELEAALRQYLKNADTRMVHGFDFDKGEYPVTSETISILCAEKQQLQAQIEAVKNCGTVTFGAGFSHQEAYLKKVDVFAALESKDAYNE